MQPQYRDAAIVGAWVLAMAVVSVPADVPYLSMSAALVGFVVMPALVILGLWKDPSQTAVRKRR